MSASFRARRPASPPLPHAGPPQSSQRFPNPKHGHLDADERRAAVTKGVSLSRTKYYPPGGLNMSAGEWRLLFFILLLAAGVRLFRLSWPNSVVFDEVHFGKFASRYIKTQYFVDVHPPLAKLLITLSAFIFGYDGNFDFKDIGKVYERGVPYVAMRMLPAILGVATVPLTYMTLRLLDCRATTALLASLFVTFENGMVTQSRHILLDSPLIFFTALTVFMWLGFCNEDKHEPFTETWWAWLVLSGLSLGAVASCKWVGFFTVATVGFSTIHQLWNLLGDLRCSPRLFIRHFMARALCLIVIPIVFYMMMFSIHFAILENSGEGDGFMSSEFQHTLGGRGMTDTFADVAIGSEVTIRHVNTQGGYLHSHIHNYPGGSHQQQITLYPHRDHNNAWRIYNVSDDGGTLDYDYVNDPLRYITFGSRIKLMHIPTERRLHSHDVRPPVSDVDFQNEVSCYGEPGFRGDANDDWFVELERGDKKDKESSKRLRTLRTTFRLRHALTGCYLFSHKVKLPDWGYEQQEVTCNKNAARENSLWFIETNAHPALPPDAPKVNYRLPGFLSKFLELQSVMWTTNAGLTDRHTYDSRPESWPLLRRGINFWVKENRHIYLIGNPVIWWLSTLAVFAYMSVRGLLILRAKRGYRDFDNSKVVKYDGLCGFLFMGWVLHYAPFYIMGRQLFLHHYFPALYFAILLFSGVFDLVTSTLRPRVRLQVAGVLAIIAIWTFLHFSPLAYGSQWTKSACNNSKWLKTWDFSCGEYHDNYSQYTQAAATLGLVTAPVTTAADAGGRPPIVVIEDERPAKDVQRHEEHTSLAGGKVEPGRDIFADKVEKDIRSQAAPVPPAIIPPVEKEVSRIMTDAQSTPEPEQKETVAIKKPEQPVPHQEDDLPAADAKGTKAEAPKVEAVITTTSSKAQESLVIDEKKVKIPAGPKDEMEAEADRVAQELYPDAVQK